MNIKETKMIIVTDESDVWHPCYLGNQVEVGISANRLGDNYYVKLCAFGADDFGVEIEYDCYNEKHLMQMYSHFKHYIYDKIVNGVNLEWFYEHGFTRLKG